MSEGKTSAVDRSPFPARPRPRFVFAFELFSRSRTALRTSSLIYKRQDIYAGKKLRYGIVANKLVVLQYTDCWPMRTYAVLAWSRRPTQPCGQLSDLLQSGPCNKAMPSVWYGAHHPAVRVSGALYDRSRHIW